MEAFLLITASTMAPSKPSPALPVRSNTTKKPSWSRWILYFGALLLAGVLPASADLTLVPVGSTWKYKDDGSNQGSAWSGSVFDDSSWASGPAELGYGDGDEATVVNGGPSTNHFITTYFRQAFSVTDPTAFNSLKLRLLRDDGAVVYVNGVEIRRDNMPTGTVSYTTLASTALSAPAEATFYESTVPSSALVAGTNVIAVEIHQANATSSDISFNLELIGVDTQSVTRGPYLQNGTPSAVSVRWRTNVATNSRVAFGTSPAALSSTVDNATSTTEHEVRLTGLTPNMQYYYSVGTTTATLASGSDYSFFTAPPAGTVQPTRVWVLGDSGTADAGAAAVRNAYTNFAGTRNTDVWLMLGDNAYNSGTDAEYQAAVFDMYPSFLRQSVLWSAIGNHETAQATNPPLTIPYFQIFTLPTNAEAGGLPSGTEKYYSFDYANIHFICLDSMTSSRLPGSPMLTWLQNDLAATSQGWIVAFWHHPAYTKGSHDSDTETELIEMRQNVLPILEAGGVDLVLAGHSHCYERSYFINGHYGISTTFSGQNLIDGGSGREDGTGVYSKPDGLPANQGAVYITAGNGGHVTNWTGGSTAEFNPTPLPAMFYSALHKGSLVLDVNGTRLDVKMIRDTGVVDDYFTIEKNVPNVPPTVAIASPTEGASFTAPANISVTANATDSDGSIAQVDFYANSTVIGSVTTAPYTITWNNVSQGTYALTAAATDNKGATVSSAPVNITVLPAPPAAPTSLTATAGDAAVSLAWSASSGAQSYNVKRSLDGAGPFNAIATGVTATSFVDNSVSNGTTYYYVVTATNAGGESGQSNIASATPQAPPPQPPAAPTSLVASAGDAVVSLNWNASSGATSYSVKRGLTSGGTYTTIATGLTAPGYSDNSVTNGTTYFYIVTASNTGGESGPSNEASATPQAPIALPAAPTGLTASTLSKSQIRLTWTDNATNETGYKIERAQGTGSFVQIATVGANVTTFTNTGLKANKSYSYRVRATNAGGDSAYSNTASTTTLRR